MGTPLPPNEPGDDCFRCWGPGEAFGDGNTPRFVKLTLSDIQEGEFWDPDLESNLLITHVLEQDVNPCSWFVIDSGIVWAISFLASNAIVLIQRIAPFEPAFSNTIAPKCLLEYNDLNTTPAGVIAHSGKVTLSWELAGLD